MITVKIENIVKIAIQNISFFIVIICSVSCVTNDNSIQQEPVLEQRRFFDEPGKFSLILPVTWKAVEMQGLEYTVLKIGDFGINLGFDILINNELNKFVDRFIEDLTSEAGKNFTFLHRGDFITLRNIKGERVMANLSLAGHDLRQIYYFLPGKYDNIMQAVGSMVFTEGGNTGNKDAFEETVDKIMQTFEWTDHAESNMSADGTRFFEESGGFSVIPFAPLWKQAEGSRYKTLKFEAQEDNNEANVIFFINMLHGKLNEFVDDFLKQYHDALGGEFELIEKRKFAAKMTNIHGEKTICLFNDGGVHYRLTFYFFPGNNHKVVTALCASLVKDDEFYIDVFDKTMDTFKWVD